MGTKPSWIEGLVSAILHTTQVNVIAVDWVYGSTGAYPSAVENVTQLALSISQFISKLLVSYCVLPVVGTIAREHCLCKQPRELLTTCCLQELNKQAFYLAWCSTKEISVLLFSQSRLEHATLFLLSLEFSLFLEKHPSCQLPLQPRTNLKGALVFLQFVLH